MNRPALLVLAFALSAAAQAEESRWFKGNTHTHSLWSDGNDFPEMITAWYKDHGYDFMSMSDHNILARGEKWMRLEEVNRRQRGLGRGAMQKYLARYGEEWVETRSNDGGEEVRLKTLEEYRGGLEEPGRFLIIEAEEITGSAGGKPIHINAINLDELIPAIKAEDASETRDVMRRTAAAVAAQEASSGRPILAYLNHPNFQWAVTAEDLARVAELKFFEVYNGHPGVNHLGDETRPGDERIWDIANTIRLAELDEEPVLGVATDDSHTYHGGDVSPGRGWVMVRAPALDADALVEAMKAGDFYASSGVTLDEIAWDEDSRVLRLRIRPEEGATHVTRFIGTRGGYDASKPQEENGIGEVFAEKEGDAVEFAMPEDALFLRATITSSLRHPNPSFPGQLQQAWIQPVGWR